MKTFLLNMRFLLGRVYFRYRGIFRAGMTFPTYSEKMQRMIGWSNDRVRHATMALALERIRSESIPGAIAELGVYRGYVSRFLHEQMPERKLYLFDTFDGFRDNADNRFRNTSVEIVKERLRNLDNVEFRIGLFPDTAKGLEHETFSFVLFDADKYDVAMASFAFFYPRLSHGGYFFLHDFNSNESDWGSARPRGIFFEENRNPSWRFPIFAARPCFARFSRRLSSATTAAMIGTRPGPRSN